MAFWWCDLDRGKPLAKRLDVIALGAMNRNFTRLLVFWNLQAQAILFIDLPLRVGGVAGYCGGCVFDDSVAVVLVADDERVFRWTDLPAPGNSCRWFN